MKTYTEEDVLDEVIEKKNTKRSHSIIVWNDDVTTFQDVIEALVEILGHSPQQAEQCSYIIHFQGKASVKNGDFETLRPLCEGIIDRGINATIEDNN